MFATDEIPRRLPAQKQTIAELGQFLLEWARVEERLLSRARRLTERNVSVREGLKALVAKDNLPQDIAESLDSIRRTRNIAAHTPDLLKPQQLTEALGKLRELLKRLPPELKPVQHS